jgi:hypothetical protein
MYQEVEEPIDVIAVFEKGRMRPLRFRWKNRVYKIQKVTGDWHSDVGRYRLRHFAVVDQAANYFQLSFDQYDAAWSLTKISVE